MRMKMIHLFSDYDSDSGLGKMRYSETKKKVPLCTGLTLQESTKTLAATITMSRQARAESHSLQWSIFRSDYLWSSLTNSDIEEL